MVGVALFVLAASTVLLGQPASAFVPNKVWDTIISRVDGDRTGKTITHRDMTSRAALEVTLSLFRDNPNPHSKATDSLQREASGHSQLNPRLFFYDFYGSMKTTAQRLRAFQGAVLQISRANEEVDMKAENNIAAAHFDAESFQESQNRLLIFRSILVGALRQQSFVLARKMLGRLMHTLQDFYSHSNWVEMGNEDPYHVLGRPGLRPTQIAPPDMPTCNDCVPSGKVSSLLKLVLFLKFDTVANYYYNCSGNIRSEVLSNRVLTSTYFSGCKDSRGNEISKPHGKCSHGSVTDDSSDISATGGINKDSEVEMWTYTRSGHAPASRLATDATVDFLHDIRRELGNDSQFAGLFNVDLTADDIVSGITIVLDTTQGMEDELASVIALVLTSRETLEGDGGTRSKFILVPFGDPGVGAVTETQSAASLVQVLERLTTQDGGDCPEPSIEALITAARASDPGSSIFVFTDAPAKDRDRLAEAQAVLHEKSIKVNYIITPGNCYNEIRRSSSREDCYPDHEECAGETSSTMEAYDFIADYSGGLVLTLDSSEDIPSLSPVVGFATQNMVVTLLQRRISGGFHGNLTFAVDESVSSFIVSISSDSGLNVSIATPSGYNLSLLPMELYRLPLTSDSSYIAMVSAADHTHLHGEWNIDLGTGGDSSVVVTAASTVSVTHRLYSLDSSVPYGFRATEDKLQPGEKVLLVVQQLWDYGNGSVDEQVTIESASLLSMEGEELDTLRLTFDGNTSYLSDPFSSPNSSFKVRVKGHDTKGNTLSRVIPSTVDQSDIDLSLGEDENEFYILRPGATRTITLKLRNYGNAASFNISTTSSNGFFLFTHHVAPRTVTLGADEMATVSLTLRAVRRTGLARTAGAVLTAYAHSLDGGRERNDFCFFDIIVSTDPPPSVTENDYYVASSGSAVCFHYQLLFVYVILQTLINM